MIGSLQLGYFKIFERKINAADIIKWFNNRGCVRNEIRAPVRTFGSSDDHCNRVLRSLLVNSYKGGVWIRGNTSRTTVCGAVISECSIKEVWDTLLLSNKRQSEWSFPPGGCIWWWRRPARQVPTRANGWMLVGTTGSGFTHIVRIFGAKFKVFMSILSSQTFQI